MSRRKENLFCTFPQGLEFSCYENFRPLDHTKDNRVICYANQVIRYANQVIVKVHGSAPCKASCAFLTLVLA